MKKGLLFMLAFTLVLPAGLGVVLPARAAADTTLYFYPSSTSVAVGDDFTLEARVNPGTNAVSAVEPHVTFDQTKFRLDSITASGAFSLELSAASINNTNGTGSIALAVPLANPSVTTTTAVATFAFHALATVSNSSIAFANSSLAAADGESGNVITTRTPASVTVTGSGSDTTAPVRSSGSPSGALASGTTETTVSLTTDEFAVCKYSTSTGVAFGSMTNTFSVTSGTSHSFTATGLTNGTSYAYSVRCEDGSNNANSDDYTISFSVASASNSQNDDDDDGGSGHKEKKKKKPVRYVGQSKSSVSRGQVLVQRGDNFSKNAIVLVYFSKPRGGYYPPQKVRTSASGKFTLTYRVTKPAGTYSWYVVDPVTKKQSKVRIYRVR